MGFKTLEEYDEAVRAGNKKQQRFNKLPVKPVDQYASLDTIEACDWGQISKLCWQWNKLEGMSKDEALAEFQRSLLELVMMGCEEAFETLYTIGQPKPYFEWTREPESEEEASPREEVDFIVHWLDCRMRRVREVAEKLKTLLPDEYKHLPKPLMEYKPGRGA